MGLFFAPPDVVSAVLRVSPAVNGTLAAPSASGKRVVVAALSARVCRNRATRPASRDPAARGKFPGAKELRLRPVGTAFATAVSRAGTATILVAVAVYVHSITSAPARAARRAENAAAAVVDTHTAITGLAVLGTAASLPPRVRPWVLGAAFAVEAITISRTTRRGRPIRLP